MKNILLSFLIFSTFQLQACDCIVYFDIKNYIPEVDYVFTGKVVEVREATADEISHGHVHGAGGVEH